MKFALSLLAGIALLPGLAHAQSYDDTPTFSGVKVGVSADYRWLDGDFALPAIDGDIDHKKGGFGFRGHVGYDVQAGDAFVIGAEAGIGRGGRSIGASTPDGDYRLKPRWSWDVSGRVGVLPSSALLVYGRAGYSWLRTRETTDFQDAALQDLSVGATEKGFLWGAGLETALSSGAFVRAEFNQANYGDGLKAPKVQLGLAVGF